MSLCFYTLPPRVLSTSYLKLPKRYRIYPLPASQLNFFNMKQAYPLTTGFNIQAGRSQREKENVTFKKKEKKRAGFELRGCLYVWSSCRTRVPIVVSPRKVFPLFTLSSSPFPFRSSRIPHIHWIVPPCGFGSWDIVHFDKVSYPWDLG